MCFLHNTALCGMSTVGLDSADTHPDSTPAYFLALDLTHGLPCYKSTSPQAPRRKAALEQVLAVFIPYQKWRSVSHCSRLQVERLQHAPRDSKMKQTSQIECCTHRRQSWKGRNACFPTCIQLMASSIVKLSSTLSNTFTTYSLLLKSSLCNITR